MNFTYKDIIATLLIAAIGDQGRRQPNDTGGVGRLLVSQPGARGWRERRGHAPFEVASADTL